MLKDHLTLFAVIAWGLLAVSCATAPIEPIDIYSEDMCSRCRMAISDKRFAGEIVLKSGSALKFDDLGCMQAYLKELVNRSEVAAIFVIDFGSGDWLSAETAYYVQTEAITTPMASGLVAFKNKWAADEIVTRQGATLVSSADFLQH